MTSRQMRRSSGVEPRFFARRLWRSPFLGFSQPGVAAAVELVFGRTLRACAAGPIRLPAPSDRIWLATCKDSAESQLTARIPSMLSCIFPPDDRLHNSFIAVGKLEK